MDNASAVLNALSFYWMVGLMHGGELNHCESLAENSPRIPDINRIKIVFVED